MFTIYIDSAYFDFFDYRKNSNCDHNIFNLINNIISNNDAEDEFVPKLKILKTEDELSNELKNQESKICIYRKSYNLETHPKIWLNNYCLDENSIEKIKNLDEIESFINNNPFSILILDITVAEAEKIRNKTSHLIISSQETFDSFIIEKNISKNLRPNTIYDNGYKEVFKTLNFKRFLNNTIVITDPFLFTGTKKPYALKNYRDLLDILMPKTIMLSECCNKNIDNNNKCEFCGDYSDPRFISKLNIEYQIIIISEYKKIDENQTNELINELNQLKNIRDYNINVEFVLASGNSIFHHRGLISNYHCIFFSNNESVVNFNNSYKTLSKRNSNLIELKPCLKYVSRTGMDFNEDGEFQHWSTFNSLIEEVNILYKEAEKNIKSKQEQRDLEAQRKFGLNYAELKGDNKKEICKRVPHNYRICDSELNNKEIVANRSKYFYL